MEAFSASLALCAGNSPVAGELPSQRASDAEFDISLMLVRAKSLIYRRVAGDLRRHGVICDVTVMRGQAPLLSEIKDQLKITLLSTFSPI